MNCLISVVESNIFMANGALYQGGESSPNKCRSWPAAAWSRAARGSASPGTGLRFVRAASISLPGRSLPARSAGKNSRSHSIGHLETSAPDHRTAPKVCEEQRSHHRSDRNRRVKCVSADSKGAWLSRIGRAALFKFMFPIRLIACSSRSSRRLTRFWSPVASAPRARAGRRSNMRIAAIYARVSSEQQREENTIASQTASLIEFAKSHDLEVPKEWVFEDEGYSGATLERPGLERVRDLAAEGQIQVVLAYSPDRLSRKYAYQILLIEEFARHGVETLFVKSPQGNSPEDHLLVQFQGMIAEYERAQILERSRRGKRHRAQAGEVSVMSGAPYGYRYIRKTDEALAAYLVEQTEASVVRRVYEMYTVEGLSIAEITRKLNNEGIPPRRAGRWERSVIWSILRNPAYCGVACFGKTRLSARAQMRPQRRRGVTPPSTTGGHQRPREEWIEIPVPALVTEETFARPEELIHQQKMLAL